MNHRLHRRLLPLLAPVLLLAPSFAEAQDRADQPTVVIVVRHAERATEPAADPALTEAGTARAHALVRVARDAGVTAVYTSNFRRTQDTGRPLADSLGLTVSVVPVDRARAAEYPADVAAAVLKHRGETVLVVSHSNTVPPIVRALGGADVGAMTEAEYDHLYIVIIPPSGPVRTIRAMYGLPAVPTRAP